MSFVEKSSMLAGRLCVRAARATRSQAISWTATQHEGWRGSHLVLSTSRRIFVSTPRHRKDDARIQTQQAELQSKQPAPEGIKPESTEREKPAEPTRPNDPLLAEQTKTIQEQRRADWRIIKDMSHYIWPKDDLGTRFRVGLSVVLLVGAKVGHTFPRAVAHMLIEVCRSSTSKFPSTSNRSSTA